jgi:hypothetical protein
MVALRLVRLIETHSETIAARLVDKLRSSEKTRDMRRLSETELLTGTRELLSHLSEWLLTKTNAEIENRYSALGRRLARQDIALAHCCWALIMTKEYLWDFLQKQGPFPSPVELYGEMELLCLLNQFFDHAICYTVEAYDFEYRSRSETGAKVPKKHGEFNPAAFVP